MIKNTVTFSEQIPQRKSTRKSCNYKNFPISFYLILFFCKKFLTKLNILLCFLFWFYIKKDFLFRTYKRRFEIFIICNLRVDIIQFLSKEILFSEPRSVQTKKLSFGSSIVNNIQYCKISLLSKISFFQNSDLFTKQKITCHIL